MHETVRKKITPKVARELRADIEAALVSVCKKHALDVTMDVGTYTTERYTVTMTLENTIGTEQRVREGWQNAVYLGFEESDLGREVNDGNERYQIVGWNGRAPKYPIMLRHTRTRKLHKATPDYVLALCHRPDPNATDREYVARHLRVVK